MSKSSGVPYFNGDPLCHNGLITSMNASVQPIMTVYPRTIGGVLKAGGVNTKTISLDCSIITPTDATRSECEDLMNTINEKFGPATGTLVVDDNSYPNCSVNGIKYDSKIVDNFIKFSIEFRLGDQTDASITPLHLYEDTRGRVGSFTVEDKGTFTLLHNVDITRDLANDLTIKIADKDDSDEVMTFSGGFETITAYCWMKAAGDQQEDGWKQTVGAYIYRIMTEVVGEMGTLSLGTSVINNCLFTDVTLNEVWPTSARYQLTFLVSLQC